MIAVFCFGLNNISMEACTHVIRDYITELIIGGL